MAITVHIPAPLLKKADQRAHELGISRDQLIVQALERELNEGSEWSPGFFEQLLAVDEDGRKAVEEMVAAIHEQRRSKAPPQFQTAEEILELMRRSPLSAQTLHSIDESATRRRGR